MLTLIPMANILASVYMYMHVIICTRGHLPWTLGVLICESDMLTASVKPPIYRVQGYFPLDGFQNT